MNQLLDKPLFIRILPLFAVSIGEFYMTGSVGLFSSVAFIVFAVLLLTYHKDLTKKEKYFPLFFVAYSVLVPYVLLPILNNIGGWSNFVWATRMSFILVFSFLGVFWFYFYKLYSKHGDLTLNQRALFWYLFLEGSLRVVLSFYYFFYSLATFSYS